MKKSLTFIMLLAAVSCAKEQGQVAPEPPLNDSPVQAPVQATADNFKDGNLSTKTVISQSGTNPPTFAWKSGDVIGVVPADGKTYQTNFEVKEISSDPKQASFDGGEWALKSGRSYTSYYPCQRLAAISGDELDFSFLGQEQKANDNLEHLGKYDYMYASAVTPVDNKLNFSFKHLISLVRFCLTVPMEARCSGVVLESTENWFAEKLYLRLNDGATRAGTLLKSYQLPLNNIDVSTGSVLTVWLAVMPTASLKGKTLNVTLNSNKGPVFCSISITDEWKAGTAYSYTCTLHESAPELVDLGLSVKWSSCNIGASSPEGYGDYYAWAELDPYYESGQAQSPSPAWRSGKSAGYAWKSYKYCEVNTDGSLKSLTKYNSSDKNATILADDDIATKKYGANWHIPTETEWRELYNNCNWAWTQQSGVNGYLVSSKTKSASIFLPAAGKREDTNRLGTSDGYYWSSTLKYPLDLAFCFNFEENGKYFSNYHRRIGFTIRPVCK